jgi:Asp/Glu/hydantoin racemase
MAGLASSRSTNVPPRIMLIHAVSEAIPPIHTAFKSLWPQADAYDLLDASLTPDLTASGGKVDATMAKRFVELGRYAAAAGVMGRQTDAILFTCSAFGPAMDAVKESLPIPVLKPNEGAFERALDAGSRIGVLVTFAPALEPLLEELRAMSQSRGVRVMIDGRVATGALEALRRSRLQDHDELVCHAIKTMSDQDVIVLGQFSTARAASAARACTKALVLTMPESAVEKLKETVSSSRGASTGSR